MRPESPDPVRVGCRCAGKLEGDPLRARRRERLYADLALKLETFLADRSWRRSGAGERFDTKDWSVLALFGLEGWVASISHQRVCFNERLEGFESATHLRERVFVRLLELVADERIGDYPLREPEFDFVT